MPLEVIPVLDLAGGDAVHARGGDRARYAPVRSVLAPGAPGDPLALARAALRLPGVRRLYVADLDALAGRAPQSAMVAALAALAPGGVLLDAGVRRAADLPALRTPGIAPVLGTETLAGLDAALLTAAGPGAVLSLDLRDGVPLLTPALAGALGDDPVAAIARLAAGAGLPLVALDLARVGSAAGPDLRLLDRLRAAAPGLRRWQGGAVRDASDLAALRRAGCDAALVGSALHEGRLTASDLAAQSAASSSV